MEFIDGDWARLFIIVKNIHRGMKFLLDKGKLTAHDYIGFGTIFSADGRSIIDECKYEVMLFGGYNDLLDLRDSVDIKYEMDIPGAAALNLAINSFIYKLDKLMAYHKFKMRSKMEGEFAKKCSDTILPDMEIFMSRIIAVGGKILVG